MVFNSILSGLNHSSKSIQASAVLLADGFPVAIFPPNKFKSDVVGGMNSALMHFGGKLAGEMLGCGPDWVCLTCEAGGFLIAHAGSDKLLVTSLGQGANMAQIIPSFTQAADRIRALDVSDLSARARGDKASSVDGGLAAGLPWRAGLTAELEQRDALRGVAIMTLLAAQGRRDHRPVGGAA